jgi:hypothetical protein
VMCGKPVGADLDVNVQDNDNYPLIVHGDKVCRINSIGAAKKVISM